MHFPTTQAKLRGKSAFTLVELLVVISLIALLVGMLLPTLSGARSEGRKSYCLNSERQMGIAFGNYNVDYNDNYPYINPSKSGQGFALGNGTDVFGSQNNNGPWVATILRYLGDFGEKAGKISTGIYVPVYHCPEAPWPQYDGNNQQDMPAAVYGMNSNAFPTNWDGGSLGKFNDPTNVIDLKNPNMTLLLGENVNGSPGPLGLTWLGGCGITSTLFATNYFKDYGVPGVGQGWIEEQFGTMSTSSNTMRTNHPSSISYGWNELLADGHAGFRDRKLVSSITNGTGKVSTRYWSNK